MQPTVMTADDLAETLETMAKAIRSRDSFEGGFQYTCMDANIFDPVDIESAFNTLMELKPGEFLVRGMFRTGNSMGQGGAHLIGDMESGT